MSDVYETSLKVRISELEREIKDGDEDCEGHCRDLEAAVKRNLVYKSENAQFREALERLASCEALTTPFYLGHVPKTPEGKELKARLRYAEESLQPKQGEKLIATHEEYDAMTPESQRKIVHSWAPPEGEDSG